MHVTGAGYCLPAVYIHTGKWKIMNRNQGVFVLLIGVCTMLLSSCGGDGPGPGSGDTAVQTTTITTSQQGSQASYGGAQAAMLANTASTDSVLAVLNGTSYLPAAPQTLKSGDAVYDRLGGSLTKLIKLRTTSSTRASAARVGSMAATTEVIQCSSGYYESSVSSTLTTFELIETYYNCDDGAGTVLNGTLYYAIHVTALNAATFTLRFGDGDNVLEPSDFTVVTSSGGTPLSTATASLTFSVDLNTVPNTTVTYKLDVNGALQDVYTNAAANGSNASQTDTLRYDSYAASVSWDSVTGIWSQRVNGGISLSRLNNAVNPAETTGASFVYQNLELDGQTNTAGNYILSIKGTISTDFTPDYCYEGTFTFSTVMPLEFSAATGQAIAGHLIINTAVHVLFNPDGSVSVSTDGGVTYTTYTLAELAGLCLLPSL